MIAVIETTMGNISHEAFNAGMIFQLHNVYPDEEIIYFCEQKQADTVKKILDINNCKRNIKFSTFSKFYLDYSKENVQRTKKQYIKILKKCDNARLIMILSMEPVNSGLIKNVIRKFNNIRFGICIHGYIENLLPQNNFMLSRKLNVIKSINEYQKSRIALKYFNKNLNDMVQMPNCNIILYSDMYKKYKDCINPLLYKNIKVLNLPYLFTYNKKEIVDKRKIKIGIMPSSMAAKDGNCKKVMQYINKQEDRINYPYQFMILNYRIKDYKNAVHISKPGRTRKDVENFMNMCDWILIPYDEKKYILSSSGVMFDTIEAERPFFALGSPTFFKAINAGCGIQENSIEALGERIIWQINHKNSNYENYCSNIRKFKKKMEKENMERIKMIFGDQEGNNG